MGQNKSQKKENKAKYGLKLTISIKIKIIATLKVGKKQVSEIISKKQLDQSYVEQENSDAFPPNINGNSGLLKTTVPIIFWR